MFALKEKEIKITKYSTAQHSIAHQKTIKAIKYAAKTHKMRLCQGDLMFVA